MARGPARMARRVNYDHGKISGEVAEQDVALDLRVLCGLCGTSYAEAHVPVRESMGRAPRGLNVRLPDTHLAAAVFSGAAVDMPLCVFIALSF